MTSAEFLDTQELNLSKPLRIWEQAGLCSTKVKKTTTVSWMLLGVYQTNEKLFQMNLAKSEECLGCDQKISESLDHLLFYCPHYQNIRESYLPEFFKLNCKIHEILDNRILKLVSILDPESSKLPLDVRSSWSSVDAAYEVARNFCHDIHIRACQFLKILISFFLEAIRLCVDLI